MNNGKVRIYELSKDLNLDNKDILTICDRLSISVKSHSSTITAEDAAQIRSAASNYRPSSAPKRVAKPKPVKAADRQRNGAHPPRKQQILEIRRHKSSQSQANQLQAPASTPVSESSPVLKKAESGDDSKSTVAPPTRPVPRPARPTKSAFQTSDSSIASKPQPSRKSVSPSSSAEPATTAERLQSTASPSAAPKPRPSLVSPPSRPAKPSAASAPERPLVVVNKSADDADKPVRPASPRTTIPITEIDDDDDGKVVQLKPKPKLKRPKVDREDAVKDQAPSTSTDSGDAVEADGESAVPILKRPSASKPPSKRKGRSEEEEEQEMRRSSKGAKAKRRAQVEEDEEEDLAEVFDMSDVDSAPAQLSISLARPQKPKSKSSPGPKSAASSSPPKRRSSSSDNSRSQQRQQRHKVEEPNRPEKIVLNSGLSVQELANRISIPETEIIKSLFFKGIVTNINQTLDIPTATMVAEEFEIEVEIAEAESEARKVTEMLDVDDLEKLQRRPPVVTIMGHVDHGKTTLLDSIRQTKVAQGEAGGITQHIGAYHVDVEHGDSAQQIVFLDTPGHEAFTAMRARGTRVTDIAILVVAADDGVRPQTIEAISHAKAAEVPLIVAINKIDKEGAQPDRVKQELMEHQLVPEEWGGDTIMVPVSALNNENLDDLLEMVLLVAEVEDLNANPDRPARGTVIEANLDKARGPVATLLVQNGTLKVGDSLVVGSVFGKVRAMIDDRNHRVELAAPSFAVEVLGLNDVPAAGDEFEVFTDEKEARSVASDRAAEQRQSRLQQAMASRRVTLNTLSAQAQEGDLKELNILLKADVQGSIEAILGALQQLPQDEVQIRVLLAAPGEISETDVDLAAASSAVIIGFNTTLATGARQSADQAGVDIRDYDIIYKLLEDIQGAMEGLLEPELVEEPLGQVDVRAVFPVRKGSVAGCYVLSGKVSRNCRIRVNRNGSVVYEGNLDSLKRMKDDVKEVAAGFECGIGVNNFSNWQEGDQIEAFKLVTKRRTLAMA
ncbi:MAG: translation initiation factor IF-2 [Cyanobacteria bacterium P01_D01_bin.128]